MQVYQTDTDFYYKKDKYWGRELKEEGLKNALCRFFDNGSGLRVFVIRKVLARLEQLRSIIEKQSCYRFYSWYVIIIKLKVFWLYFVHNFSSLLIVYEGTTPFHNLAVPKSEILSPIYSNTFLAPAHSTPQRNVSTSSFYDADTSNSSTEFNTSFNSDFNSTDFSNSTDFNCRDFSSRDFNNSTDFNGFSSDEVSQDSHHRGFGEAAARGARCGLKTGNFVPINEETVFLGE